MPKGEHSINRYLQRLGGGQCILGKTPVGRIELWIPLVVLIQRWGWDVVASTPDKHLFLTVLLGRFGLVQSLECAIVPFIKSPVFLVVNPIQVKLVRYGVPCLDCSLQNRCVAGIE